MVRAGMGTALLPRLAILSPDTRADTTLSTHQLQPPLSPREIFLLWEKGRTHSPLRLSRNFSEGFVKVDIRCIPPTI